MKDTLLVKEYRQVVSTLKVISDFAPKVKSATPEELDQMSQQMNKITVDDWDFCVSCVKRCYDITDEQLDKLHNADLFFLFSELINESRQIKKKLPKQLETESLQAAIPPS